MPPFYYDCPVCKKTFQQGQLGKHLLRYSSLELQPYIINYENIQTDGAHPEILCSGRTYVICPNTQKAYEKVGGKLEKEHRVCTHKYNNYFDNKNGDEPRNEFKNTILEKQNPKESEHYTSLKKNELISLCKTRCIDGYSGKNNNELIQILVNNDVLNKDIPRESVCFINLDEHNIQVKPKCDCSQKMELLEKELNLYKMWAKSILSSMPDLQSIQEDDVNNQPSQNQSLQNQPSQNQLLQNQPLHNQPLQNHPLQNEQLHNQPSQNQPLQIQQVQNQQVQNQQIQNKETNNQVQQEKIVEGKQTKKKSLNPSVKRSAKIIASKKEMEKGLWCKKCESCNNIAQYATELKPCQICNKLCHRDNDLYGCYHWDCSVCDKKICKECNKVAGGNKLFPFCSTNCRKQHVS